MTRVEVIQSIQKLSHFWDASADDAARTLARDPNNKDKRERAVNYVALMDAYHKFAGDVITIVNGAWPKEEGGT